MWENDELGFDEPTHVDELHFDEPTRVYEKDAGPRSGPILLTNRVEDLEIIEIVDITPSRPPPPPRRTRLPKPVPPSLHEATPTRPGHEGFSNELLFVDVTPGAFTLASIEADADEDENRTTLEPAILEADDAYLDMRPRSRVPKSLWVGAAAAVLLAVASYANGPVVQPVQAARAAFSLRSPEVIAHEAGLGSHDLSAETSSPTKSAAKAASVKTTAKAKSAGAQTSAAGSDGASKADGASETGNVSPASEPDEATSDDASMSDTENELTDALAPEFNVEAARTSLGGAAANASACGNGEAQGSVRVSVTFAKSGKAIRARVAGDVDNEVSACIVSNMLTATIPAYSGKMVTVAKTVKLR